MASNPPPELGATSVFYPHHRSAADSLKSANLFTRVHIRATPEAAKIAVESTPQLRNTFCLLHHNDVLVFDKAKEDHITHTRAVLQMLRDKNMKADIDRCAFDKETWGEAGFHIDPLSDGEAFMIILREHLADDALASIDRTL